MRQGLWRPSHAVTTGSTGSREQLVQAGRGSEECSPPPPRTLQAGHHLPPGGHSPSSSHHPAFYIFLIKDTEVTRRLWVSGWPEVGAPLPCVLLLLHPSPSSVGAILTGDPESQPPTQPAPEQPQAQQDKARTPVRPLGRSSCPSPVQPRERPTGCRQLGLALKAWAGQGTVGCS